MTDHIDFDPDDENLEKTVIQHPEASADRSIARRAVLQILYEVDSTHHVLETIIVRHPDRSHERKGVRRYINKLARGVADNRVELDRMIQVFAPEWPLDQIAIVDRNILRLALYELGIDKRVPVPVVIDEAIQLARVFGAESSIRFINGVLGSAALDIEVLRQKFGDVEQQDNS